ncbi:YopX family protein [Streptococcus fryi]
MIPKFRAYCKSMGKMCDVVIINYMTGSITVEIDGIGYLLQPSDYDPMESTGHFDINSQEIFEGDLLDTSDSTGNIISSGNPILEVCFDGLEFTVKGNIENGEMSFKEFKEICELAGIPLKVIGNVYENPDLVEVSNDTEI